MASKCHAHIAPGHYTIEQAREVLAANPELREQLGWQSLASSNPELEEEFFRDTAERLTEWRVPTIEELNDLFGDGDCKWGDIVAGFADIAATLGSGEVWVIVGVGDSGPQTLVVGMSLD